MSRDETKSVIGVSEQGCHKPACTVHVTAECCKLDILDVLGEKGLCYPWSENKSANA